MPCGRVVAIKQVVQDESDVNREVEICKIMAATNPPNIVEAVRVRAPSRRTSTISTPSRRDMRLKLSLAQAYMYQQARALLVMHQLGVVHRNLKPNSTLVNSVTRILKLSD